MTELEFEKIWRECKENDARIRAEFNALPEDEKKCLNDIYSDAFYERISDDLTGDSDDEIGDTDDC